MHEKDARLEYRAVDSNGVILWTAQRPRVCSAYLVTTTDSGPIAVLMDQGPTTGGSLTSTASGYDLETGQKRWGPVETPGAMLGNGLVFASAPKDFIGTGGPRTALDPATGDVVAAENDDTSTRVVALFSEHLVRSRDDNLIGENLDGDRLWTRTAGDFDVSAAEAREIPWEPIGATHALLGDAGSEERTLIDLNSGASVDSDISGAWFDSSTDTLVTAGADLQGFDSDGSERWESPLPENAEVAAVGAGLIAFDTESTGGPDQTDRSVAARSARNGSLAEGDTPLLRTLKSLGSPHHIAESGAALVGDPQSPLLITGRR
ncbi:PQQ-binding-like beta-propeller repeat protein [Brevibacterium aurantiacum]|uniref:PQQ-like beta-propeller repeat protein n=1 Tax=Brevibacterium aurantiacum TaxID=273384 RepID=A0A556CPQ2_BREAU|nr:PQQ-binding-like beta-propeller repeat protein [Brevibacterium aurantiacum]TSI19420.1 PQQ-like beta-propeller repeat protein [Brevibacterium aurantiacum]